MSTKTNLGKLGTYKSLVLLLVIFLVGFGSQLVINVSLQQFELALDKSVQNAETQASLGRDIVKHVYYIESTFFELATFPDKHQRSSLVKKIVEDSEHIKEALTLLNEGGQFTLHHELNMPNASELIEVLHYKPTEKGQFSFIEADILPKLIVIQQSLLTLEQLLEKLDTAEATKTRPLLIKLKRKFKLINPVFVRLKQNSNQVFYLNQLESQAIKHHVAKQERMYFGVQVVLTLVVAIFSLYGFWHLSRNISINVADAVRSRDYTYDVLTSQSSIIIVNDGKTILDVSGGFYDFFQSYSSLERFQDDYACVCDLFVPEEGYVYKFDDVNWIEYLIENQDQNHKVKVDYLGKISIFNISAVRSKNDLRYIISMFDITEMEEMNRILQTEKERAQEATKAKSEFLANMSHEIRTPLNAILGFIGLMLEKKNDEESTQYLQIIDRSSNTLLGLISDILDFSKIESGKIELDPINFDTVTEFNGIADLFKARCSEKNITFKVSIDKGLPPTLNGDILRIKQIVTNLLSNAVKFTEKNKCIRLDVVYADNYLKLSVADEGIGMTEKAQKTIFEAFSQAESSTTRQYGGTGLGLAISANLVKLLGGELTVTSELGAGSLFEFSIPLKVSKERIKKLNPINKLKAYKGHILLVEDNKTNQLLMSVIFKKQGLTFDIANDGLEAVEAVKKMRYDLVLMDENMPNLNGIEATKEIRAYLTDSDGHLNIVALTANAMTGERERFMAAGMDEYLTKPLKIPELQQVFDRFL